jgi:hypothetical protein
MWWFLLIMPYTWETEMEGLRAAQAVGRGGRRITV